MIKIVNQRIVAFLLLCCFCVAPLMAQEVHHRPRRGDNPEMKARHAEMRELLQRQREEYLQTSIGLTDEVAEQFFALYKAYSEERYKIFKASHENIDKLDRAEQELTDEQFMAAVALFENTPIEVAEVTIAYNKKFAEILTPKQLYLFMRAEQSFARDVLKDAKRGEHPKGKGRPRSSDAEK